MTISKTHLAEYIELARNFYSCYDADEVWDELYTTRVLTFGNNSCNRWLHNIIDGILLSEATRDTHLDIYCEIFRLLGFEIV